jgi:hypothetical protein
MRSPATEGRVMVRLRGFSRYLERATLSLPSERGEGGQLEGGGREPSTCTKGSNRGTSSTGSIFRASDSVVEIVERPVFFHLLGDHIVIALLGLVHLSCLRNLTFKPVGWGGRLMSWVLGLRKEGGAERGKKNKKGWGGGEVHDLWCNQHKQHSRFSAKMQWECRLRSQRFQI